LKRLLAILLLLCSGCFEANSDTLHLDKSLWESKIQDMDFSEGAKKKEHETQKLDNLPAPSSSNGLSQLDLESVKTILFAILILAALIIIILIIKNAKAPATIGKQRLEATSLEEAEENLPDVELNNLLDEATESGNWKVALRIQFLMLLQELIYSNMIQWKKRKTNQQYGDEITDKAIQSEFLKTVNVFDPAWYGNHPLNETEFQSVNTIILAVKKSIAHGE